MPSIESQGPGVTTIRTPTASDLGASTLVAAQQPGMGLSADTSMAAPAPGKVALTEELVALVENPATRYTEDTYTKLAGLTSRAAIARNLATRSGFSKEQARDAAIDQAVLELSQPNLPTLPSGEQAMQAARTSPELTEMRDAAQRRVLIALRDEKLTADIATATTKLRDAQATLQTEELADLQVRKVKSQRDRDKLKREVDEGFANFDQMVTDTRARNTIKGFGSLLAFIGTTMGSTINPYELARNQANAEVANQISLLDKSMKVRALMMPLRKLRHSIKTYLAYNLPRLVVGLMTKEQD